MRTACQLPARIIGVVLAWPAVAVGQVLVEQAGSYDAAEVRVDVPGALPIVWTPGDRTSATLPVVQVGAVLGEPQVTGWRVTLTADPPRQARPSEWAYLPTQSWSALPNPARQRQAAVLGVLLVLVLAAAALTRYRWPVVAVAAVGLVVAVGWWATGGTVRELRGSVVTPDGVDAWTWVRNTGDAAVTLDVPGAVVPIAYDRQHLGTLDAEVRVHGDGSAYALHLTLPARSTVALRERVAQPAPGKANLRGLVRRGYLRPGLVIVEERPGLVRVRRESKQ